MLTRCRHAIVEYWDSRGAALFHDKMNDQPFGDSSLDLKFIWDEPPPGQWVFILFSRVEL